MDQNKELFYREFVDRETNFPRAPYLPEKEFYSVIKSGNVKKIKALCNEPFGEKNGLGVLSKNKLRNLKYHFVITAAMAARYCIEGGMEYAKAYSISDVYISDVDVLTDVEEISALHKKMCIEYTTEMSRLIKHRGSIKYISACLNYIYENLHTKITVEDLARVSGLSVSYISRLFHKQTGYKIQEYILAKKVETSKNMLLYTNLSLAEISETLGFTTQSYWTQTFKKITGITPAKFRLENASMLFES